MARKQPPKKTKTYIVIEESDEAGMVCVGKPMTLEQIHRLVEMGSDPGNIRLFEGREVDLKWTTRVDFRERA